MMPRSFDPGRSPLRQAPPAMYMTLIVANFVLRDSNCVHSSRLSYTCWLEFVFFPEICTMVNWVHYFSVALRPYWLPLFLETVPMDDGALIVCPS